MLPESRPLSNDADRMVNNYQKRKYGEWKEKQRACQWREPLQRTNSFLWVKCNDRSPLSLESYSATCQEQESIV